MSVMRYYQKKWRDLILRGDPLPGWLARHSRRKYVIAVNLSMVEWADSAEIWAMRMWAKLLTRITGEKWVLDHIIPVTHPLVCGLTVPSNLRIVPYRVNASKRNKWSPDQLELFEEQDMNLKPRKNKVIAKRVMIQRVGLIELANSQHEYNQGEVVAVGDGVEGLKPGDVFVGDVGRGAVIHRDGEPLLVLDQKDVMAVIEA